MLQGQTTWNLTIANGTFEFGPAQITTSGSSVLHFQFLDLKLETAPMQVVASAIHDLQFVEGYAPSNTDARAAMTPSPRVRMLDIFHNHILDVVQEHGLATCSTRLGWHMNGRLHTMWKKATSLLTWRR